VATGTGVDVVMPQMGVSVSEGTVTKWLKNPGETVEADEPLLEISTDKVDTEVPAPGTGVLSEILVQEGETVEVGTLLARIGGEAGAAPPAHEPPPPEPATQPAADEASAAADEGVRETPAEPEPAPAPAGNGRGGDSHAFVSPVVARIAAEHGIDPSSIEGTGTGGRVTKKDILAFVEQSSKTIESGAEQAAPP
jgi:pyruvate dehydrogenase E2 component (dihydrolipoamide acetyltransferase)